MGIIQKSLIVVFILFGIGVLTLVSYKPERKIKELPALNYAYAPAPSQTRKSNWDKMIGTWYGSQIVKGGGSYSWISNKTGDGNYSLETRFVLPGGEVKEKIEFGDWGAGSKIYFSIYRGDEINGKYHYNEEMGPYYVDIYNILEISEDSLKYQNVESGEVYQVKKVPDDFQMPLINRP